MMSGLAGAPRASGADHPAAMDSRSDFALIMRMRAADESALGVLYDRWSARVYALANMILQDHRDAEDVMQDTFWQAWRDSDKCDGSRGSVGSWLLTITRSRAIDRRRARARKREDVDMGQLDSLPARSDPAGDAVAGERASAVHSALEVLPDEQRTTLELAYFGGLSQTEIAERTGEPLGTVKTRMRLAMTKLRERLEAQR